MTKIEAVRKLLENCRKDIGYKETGVNYNKFAEYLDKYNTFWMPINGYAWCAIFNIAKFVETFGFDTAKELIHFDAYSCSCSHWKNNMKQINPEEVEPGDIAFTAGYTHVGIVSYGVGNNYVYIIAGNTDDMVKEYKVDKSIMKYYRPDWEVLESTKTDLELGQEWAINNGLFKGDGNGNYRWKDPITREEVATVLMRLIADYT